MATKLMKPDIAQNNDLKTRTHGRGTEKLNLKTDLFFVFLAQILTTIILCVSRGKGKMPFCTHAVCIPMALRKFRSNKNVQKCANYVLEI